jgi:hypothetical protein
MRDPRRRGAPVVALLLLLAGAAPAREAYDGVTSINARAVHGTLSADTREPARIATLMEEINAERRKSWTSFRGTPGPCAVRLTFGADGRRVGRLVLDGDTLLELDSSERSGFQREVSSFELDQTRRFARRAQNPTDCRR